MIQLLKQSVILVISTALLTIISPASYSRADMSVNNSTKDSQQALLTPEHLGHPEQGGAQGDLSKRLNEGTNILAQVDWNVVNQAAANYQVIKNKCHWAQQVRDQLKSQPGVLVEVKKDQFYKLVKVTNPETVDYFPKASANPIEEYRFETESGVERIFIEYPNYGIKQFCEGSTVAQSGKHIQFIVVEQSNEMFITVCDDGTTIDAAAATVNPTSEEEWMRQNCSNQQYKLELSNRK